MADLFLLISRQRLAVADLLGSLTDDEWAIPSLCTGWSVREVAAHLVMPFELGLPALMWQMIKARGNFDRVANDFAHRAATTPTGELVSTLRANTDHRFTPPGLGPQAPLTDIAVHGFDIGVPLDRRPPLPAESANEILPFLVSTKSTRGLRPKGIVDGLRFSTTDTAWSGGDGPEVSGPAASLILALTARRIRLSRPTRTDQRGPTRGPCAALSIRQLRLAIGGFRGRGGNSRPDPGSDQLALRGLDE